MAKGKGFDAIAKKIAAKNSVPMKDARAILASSSRNASPAAKRRNPALKRVGGSRRKSTG